MVSQRSGDAGRVGALGGRRVALGFLSLELIGADGLVVHVQPVKVQVRAVLVLGQAGCLTLPMISPAATPSPTFRLETSCGPGVDRAQVVLTWLSTRQLPHQAVLVHLLDLTAQHGDHVGAPRRRRCPGRCGVSHRLRVWEEQLVSGVGLSAACHPLPGRSCSLARRSPCGPKRDSWAVVARRQPGRGWRSPMALPALGLAARSRGTLGRWWKGAWGCGVLVSVAWRCPSDWGLLDLGDRGVSTAALSRVAAQMETPPITAKPASITITRPWRSINLRIFFHGTRIPLFVRGICLHVFAPRK